jgi:hypothetical protein
MSRPTVKKLPTKARALFPWTQTVAIILLGFLLGGRIGRSQQLPSAPAPVPGTSPQLNLRSTKGAGWLFSAYSAPKVQASDSRNSGLVDNLIHDGKLTLTLQDAIELAIENNFDVELQRYDRWFAQTEILRSQGGGQLRAECQLPSENCLLAWVAPANLF